MNKLNATASIRVLQLLRGRYTGVVASIKELI